MTAEQRQLIDELNKIATADDGLVGTIAWRASQEIKGLIEENERLKISPKPH